MLVTNPGAKPSKNPVPKKARQTLNMRVPADLRRLIDQAAGLTGKNRTDFVLDAARLAAQNAVLDQVVLPLNAKAYASFVALLDAPPQPNEAMRKTLQTPPIWE